MPHRPAKNRELVPKRQVLHLQQRHPRTTNGDAQRPPNQRYTNENTTLRSYETRHGQGLDLDQDPRATPQTSREAVPTPSRWRVVNREAEWRSPSTYRVGSAPDEDSAVTLTLAAPAVESALSDSTARRCRRSLLNRDTLPLERVRERRTSVIGVPARRSADELVEGEAHLHDLGNRLHSRAGRLLRWSLRRP
jgi:hypothetical protein